MHGTLHHESGTERGHDSLHTCSNLLCPCPVWESLVAGPGYGLQSRCVHWLTVSPISFCQFHGLCDLQHCAKGEIPFCQEALLNALFTGQTMSLTSLEKCHSVSIFWDDYLGFSLPLYLSFVSNDTFYHVLTTVTQIAYRHFLTTPVALPNTVPACPLLLLLRNGLGLSSLSTCKKFHLAQLTFKCHNSLAPPYLAFLFHKPSHRYSTRNSNLVNLPPVQSFTNGQHSLSYLGVSLWCSLPLSIRNSGSLVTFTQATSVFYYLNWLLVCEHLHDYQSTTAWQQTFYYSLLKSYINPTWLYLHCLYRYLLSVQFSGCLV